MGTTKEKAMKGIENYLERRGIEIVETNWAHGSEHVDFVANDEGDLVFIACKIHDNEGKGIPEESIDRRGFEKVAAAYLAEKADVPEGNVRFDIVSMLILGDHRALLRHHRNALSAAGSDLE